MPYVQLSIHQNFYSITPLVDTSKIEWEEYLNSPLEKFVRE